MVPVSRARNFSYAGNKLADFFSLQTPNTQHRMPNVERSIQALPLDVGCWTLSVCCVRLVRARCFLAKARTCRSLQNSGDARTRRTDDDSSSIRQSHSDASRSKSCRVRRLLHLKDRKAAENRPKCGDWPRDWKGSPFRFF